MNTPDMTAVSVIRVPMERSMPPVMMTKVTEMPRTPATAVESMIETRLSIWKKFGDRKAKTMIMRIRLAKARTFCLALAENRLFSTLFIRASFLYFADRWVASCMMRSWVASWADSSPVMRPSHITTMRWLSLRISGSSELIITMALPCSASSWSSL